jgi:lipid-binding SYLF domain-containing protein
MKNTLTRGIGRTLLAAATLGLAAAGWAQSSTSDDYPPSRTQSQDQQNINRDMNDDTGVHDTTGDPTFDKTNRDIDRALQKDSRRHPMGTRDTTTKDANAQADARDSLDRFVKADPGLRQKLDGAVGYAILPNVAKGAVGIGGAGGKGVLFENGRATGKVTLSQVSVGLQLGGQTYSELILFQDQGALDQFKRGQFTMSAQMSAVAATAGASATARTINGVQVFTITKGGLMYEAAIGGQRFTYTPYAGESVG